MDGFFTSAACSIDKANLHATSGDGEPVLVIEGVMFHEGLNSNKWGFKDFAAAAAAAHNLQGVDVTLMHPPVGDDGFKRSEEGLYRKVGAVIRINVSQDADKWRAYYAAEITDVEMQREIMESLDKANNESQYTVSIGVIGEPEVTEDAMWFVASRPPRGDHLAIVVPSEDPAFSEANIAWAYFDQQAHPLSQIASTQQEVLEDEVPLAAADSIIYQESADVDSVTTVTDTNTVDTPNGDADERIAALTAALAEKDAALAAADAEKQAIAAAAAEKAESDRVAALTAARELGLSLPDDATSETITASTAAYEAALEKARGSYRAPEAPAAPAQSEAAAATASAGDYVSFGEVPFAHNGNKFTASYQIDRKVADSAWAALNREMGTNLDAPWGVN